jgi:hypothetical protein
MVIGCCKVPQHKKHRMLQEARIQRRIGLALHASQLASTWQLKRKCTEPRRAWVHVR